MASKPTSSIEQALQALNVLGATINAGRFISGPFFGQRITKDCFGTATSLAFPFELINFLRSGSLMLHSGG